MDSYKEEIFGPVLQVIRVKTMQDVLMIMNMAMALVSLHAMVRQLAISQTMCKWVWYVNVLLPVPVAYHSFGGWKRSLFGDLHAYGPDGVRFYTKRKTIIQRWPSSGVREGASFSFLS